MFPFCLLISEDIWLFLDFTSDHSIFSTSVRGYTNTALAEKREENQKSSLISKEKVNKDSASLGLLPLGPRLGMFRPRALST